jgi:hypothetical protein
MKVWNMGVGRVWDGMLCVCVSEEGGDGEGTVSEATSLLSSTLRYVSLSELKREVGVVYYESIQRDLQIKPIYECRCDERLKTKPVESTRLVYTGLFGELEHLKIKTMLIDEEFTKVMGECVSYMLGVPNLI